MHSTKGCFLDGIVIAAQGLTMFFKCVERFLHVFSTYPITDIAGIRILSGHSQCLIRARTANHDAWMRVCQRARIISDRRSRKMLAFKGYLITIPESLREF